MVRGYSAETTRFTVRINNKPIRKNMLAYFSLFIVIHDDTSAYKQRATCDNAQMSYQLASDCTC
jgi:hypothetical protein